MKKLLILMTLVLTTTACSVDSKPIASKNTQTLCIDGVSYTAFKEFEGYRGYGFMSVKLDKDSKVIPCGVEVE